MALTVNSTPANISNSGAFNVTTSLVEDGTHVNLRIRAEVKVATVPKATSEKPNGLPDFDFFDILKCLVPGLSFARNLGALYNVSGGSPLIAYTVTFTEVYETAGVTTTGATTTTGTFKFVPAKGDPSLAFSNYVMTGNTSRFANLTLRNNVCKFYTAVPLEFWLVFFTEKTAVELFYSKDGAAYDHATHITANDGWGVIVINAAQMMSGVASNLRIYLGEVGAAQISEVLTIYPDGTSNQDRTILEFDGLLGGKEYLPFEGQRTTDYKTIRNYMTGPKRNRMPLQFDGLNSQVLSTTFKDLYNAAYLKSLLLSEKVQRLEASYATPTPVTIITEGVKIGSPDLFANQIELEYAD